MEDTCSLCGSNKDVKSTGEVYMCASCRGEPLEISCRMRFIRWAVEQGRISDFPGKVDELYEHSVHVDHL